MYVISFVCGIREVSPTSSILQASFAYSALRAHQSQRGGGGARGGCLCSPRSGGLTSGHSHVAADY
jgi:hypothetical protein